MRIASLLPSATEMVFALGLGESLVARSAECDFPAEVLARPVVSRTSVDPSAPSAEIDQAVRTRLGEKASLYEVDEPLLAKLQPDLLLTQGLCAVCAPTAEDVRAVAARLDPKPEVLAFDAHSLEGVLAGLLNLGQATGKEEKAQAEVASLAKRLEAVRERVPKKPRPVVALEWFEPPFTAGHWVPEQIAWAGGLDLIARPGSPSHPVPWEAVVAVDPEVLLLAPCGMEIERAERELPALTDRKEWSSLRAVAEGNVWILNGSAYFNRPGPRVVRGVEILARALHPEAFGAPPDKHDAKRLRRPRKGKSRKV